MSAATQNFPASVRFMAPPPGLEPSVNFSLTPVEGAVGLFSLTATDGTARLFVLDAGSHLPQYSPRPAPTDLERLGEGTAAVLVVVNPGVQSTVNLAAPILLNIETGACRQVILEGNEWPLRAPLGAA